MVGYSKAILYVSCLDSDNMDVFLQLRKADKNGNLLQNMNIPMRDLKKVGIEKKEDVGIVNSLVYLGPTGVLRSGHRAVDPEKSKPYRPFHPHDKDDRVPPGEVAKLEIGLWPTGIVFEAGEQLVLKVAGHSMTLAEYLQMRGQFAAGNKGRHILHFGGDYPSSLLFPIAKI